MVSEFSIPTQGNGAGDITAGPDGAVWFTESDAGQIGRIPADGAVAEFALPTPNADPIGITAGPDGALWFTEAMANKVGRITTGGAVTEYRIPTPQSHPTDIARGSDGALWFNEGGGNQIGRITTDGRITEYLIPSDIVGFHGLSGVTGITEGSDRAIWFIGRVFGLHPLGRIGRITTGGALTIGTPEGVTTSRKGAVSLVLRAPEGGTFRALATFPKHVAHQGVLPTLYASGGATASRPDQVSLTMKPTAARRRALLKTRKASVVVQLSFTSSASGEEAPTQHLTIKLPRAR
jgi:streptogramin lyase